MPTTLDLIKLNIITLLVDVENPPEIKETHNPPKPS